MIKEQEKTYGAIKRVIEIFLASDGEVRPHLVLTGPSGSGKSHIIAALADDHQMGFLEINAAQLTKEGTSGNSLSKALTPLANAAGTLTLCFVDEFDKLFISGNSNTDAAHETTNGVQNEFLRVLESPTTSVFGEYGKYIQVPVDNVLFIFAGAFNGETDLTLDRLRDFGIKTEFLGRVGLIFNLEKLCINSMYEALQQSALLKKYLTLFPATDKNTVIEIVMNIVAKKHENNTLGIRLLNTLINQYFINDGKIEEDDIKKVAFNTTLEFKTPPVVHLE